MTPHKIEELVEKLQRLAKFALEDCDCGICVQCRHAEAMDGAAQTIQALMRALEQIERGEFSPLYDAEEARQIARQALSKGSGE